MYSQSKQLRLAGWAVHALTASGAIVGLYTLMAIHQHHYKVAFLLMGLSIVIDGIDGTLARALQVKKTIPEIDGALMDNLMDFINYVFTPCYFLLSQPELLAPAWQDLLVCGVLLSSCYQFSHTDAKTQDNFFRGFPSYWNLTVFYMYAFQTSQTTNTIALIILIALVFVPIKYLYLSRLDHVSHHKMMRYGLLGLTLLYAVLNLIMLYLYPTFSAACYYAIIFYLFVYFSLSLYRTFYPLKD